MTDCSKKTTEAWSVARRGGKTITIESRLRLTAILLVLLLVAAALLPLAAEAAGTSISEYAVPTSASRPFGITRGPDGAVWFTEVDGNKIGRITTKGIVTEYAVPTSGSNPYGITSGPDGALWFTEENSNKIGRITTKGVVTEYAIPAADSHPFGITSGLDGALWFTEAGGNKIGRITTKGVVSEYAVPTDGSSSRGITRGPDGAVWFTEVYGKKIGRITTGGAVSEYAVPTIGSGPYGITSGPDGALWYTKWYDNTIGRMTTAGVITEYAVPTDGGSPRGITSGPDGALWFVEVYGNKVGRITTTGAITEYTVPTADCLPFQITVGPDGALWFTEYGSNKIGRAIIWNAVNAFVSGGHGTVTPLTRTVDYGGTATMHVNPDQGYHTASVTDNGVPVTLVPTTDYTINNVNRDHEVEVTFQRPRTVCPTWYLAEGTSGWGFDTYVTIENPNPTPVTAQVTYMTKSGAKTRPDISLPAMSQTVINPGNDLGSMDFSTEVVCKEGKMIAVDRKMIWTGPGAPSEEGHSSIGVTSPAATWYLPEGSSAWGFECWLLIQNPGAEIAHCQVTYMTENAGPKIVKHDVPPHSRASFFMADDIGAADASIKVESSLPVIPERSMYRNNRREGHDSTGAITPSRDFYLAEGTTDWGFTTYVLIQNPNDQPNTVTLTYMTPAGPVPQAPFSIPANSRKTVKVNDALPGRDLSTHVQGTLPLIAERAMYWDNGSGEACHDSIGMDSPHTTIYLPDGETGGSSGMETWTLVQNPNATDVQIQVSYLTPTGSGNVVFTDTVKANSRNSYNMGDRIPSGQAAVLVTSKNPGKGVIGERAVYWNSRGAGTETVGGWAD